MFIFSDSPQLISHRGWFIPSRVILSFYFFGYKKIRCCWWKKSCTSWLIGSISHYLQGFSTIPGGCLGFLNHQQYLYLFDFVWAFWSTRTSLPRTTLPWPFSGGSGFGPRRRAKGEIGNSATGSTGGKVHISFLCFLNNKTIVIFSSYS